MSGGCIVSEIAVYPCHTRPSFANPGTASYNTIFHQEVSHVFGWGVQLKTCVPKRTLAVRASFVNPSNRRFTHACYRCDKTVFLEVLATVVPTLLAQVVLTLRLVFFCGNGLVLIVAE